MHAFRGFVFGSLARQVAIMFPDCGALLPQFPDVANRVPPSWRHLQQISFGQDYCVSFGAVTRNSVTSRTGCGVSCDGLRIVNRTCRMIRHA